jgi:hypothetical protein
VCVCGVFINLTSVEIRICVCSKLRQSCIAFLRACGKMENLCSTFLFFPYHQVQFVYI